MNPIPASMLVGALVVFSRWRKDETIGIENVVGVTVLAIMLSLIKMADTDLARAFGLLVVVGVLFGQSTAEGEIPLFKQIGLA